MLRLWWQLPGPHRFVSQIAQDIREGKNIILRLPEHAPNGLYNAMRAELEDSDAWLWERVSAHDADYAKPAHLLFSRFVHDISPDAIQNANTLSKEKLFAGKIIWLESMTSSVWHAWKEFIVEYAHSCRSHSLLDRTLFCVPLIGELALNPPAEDVCLSHHRWQNVIDNFDMLLFTSSLFQGKRMPSLQKRVAIAVVANLALWDPTVSERLACEDVKKIFEPVPVLQEIAKERAWHNTDALLRSWHLGMTDIMEGAEKIHSAALAFNDPTHEIERRIWSAEVGVMFPFVEERRQEILARFSEKLKVPFKTRFGEIINDLRDLEIGHIESQLINNAIAVNSDFRRLLQQLREMRNCLSHLEPLSLELVLACDELSRQI